MPKYRTSGTIPQPKEELDELKSYHEKASEINKFTLILELLQVRFQEDNDLKKYIAKIQALIVNLTSLGNRSE